LFLATKRAIDVVGAGCFALAALPLMLLIAIVIRFDSPGNAFFTQERVGRDGRRFRVAKFRTMGKGADERRATLMSLSSDPNWLKLDSDPRITRFGRVLRLTSLDELPQLWNVLRGEMSLVGPRPLIPTEDARLSGRAERRRQATPGLTGLWQVTGRTHLTFDQMVELDLEYVERRSIGLDLRVLLKTVPAVLFRRGAN